MMGNLIILAIRTLERASGKKDPAGTLVPCNWRFFTKMWPHIGYPQPVCFSAKTHPAFCSTTNTVDTAVTRTETAIFVGPE
jgi:hypothetical protein